MASLSTSNVGNAPSGSSRIAYATSDDRRAVLAAGAPYVQHQMSVWTQHVDDFGYTRTAADKMPRADAWRPYRFAVQDVLLAITALRHSKANNCIEVDVFVASDPCYHDRNLVPEGQDIYPYEPLTSHRALVLMLLSEAFRCGTPMSIGFLSNVERSDEERQMGAKRGRVPFAIMQLAKLHGTPLPDQESGTIKPEEAIPLYAALCGFPASLRAHIDELAERGHLSVPRACYLVQHGVWSVHELEGLIRGCPYPDLVLDGEVQPESRHLFAFVQSHARTALLGGVLDRALLARNHSSDADGESLATPKGRDPKADVTPGSDLGHDIEDDERHLSIEFDAELGARCYRLAEIEVDPLFLPNWRPHESRREESPWAKGIEKGVELIALLRPREEKDLIRSLQSDIEAASQYVDDSTQPAVVVPLDFNDLTVELQIQFLDEAKELGVWLLVCPETAKNLDDFARDKLSRSRVLPD